MTAHTSDDEFVVLSETERDELQAAVATILGSLYPLKKTREFMNTRDFDKVAWERLAREYDLLGLHLPTDLGGQGLSFAHTAIVAQEMGRQLVPAPYLASVSSATQYILRMGTAEQRANLLPGLVSGDVVMTVAAAGTDTDPLHDPVDVVASQLNENYVLTGKAQFVPHMSDSSIVLVVARRYGPGDLGVFMVAADDAGLRVSAHPTLDETRPQAILELEGCRGELLGNVPVSHEQIDQHARQQAAAEATILLACEAIGGADACLALTIDYVKMRHQFGQPIGAFQAVQHALADLYGDLESARAAVEWAVTLVDGCVSESDIRALGEASSLAKARASEAYATIAKETIHLHGGIGFTWEHDAHLYYKRALADQQFLGGPAVHRQRALSTLVG